MELNVLKLDLDLKSKKKVIELLTQRLIYLKNLKLFHPKFIKKIELIKKKSYGCKIYLKKNIDDELKLVCLQLLLGSDYRKEAFVIARHYIYNVEYSNRLYDIKQYNSNEYIIAKHIDITTKILGDLKSYYKK